jgi:hypothetical protein
MTNASYPVLTFLLDYLAELPGLENLAEAQQIRASSDQNDPPMGDAAVIVDVQDMGGHLNISDRILVDVRVQVEVRTSLAADLGLENFRTLCISVGAGMAALQKNLPETVEDWDVRFVSSPVETSLSQDSLYRFQSFTATFLLQSK